MSNIDTQIAALLLKKKKIDYISYIADLVKNDTKCLDFKDIQEEIVSKIEPFLLDLMTSIETGSDVKPKITEQTISGISQQDMDTLKLVIDAANKKIKNPSETRSKVLPQKMPVNDTMSPNDKMNFAMSNRHLANKRVKVMNDQNVDIYGLVVGLDAPHVIVKTETGPTIQVPLEKVVPS